ncbi:DUF3604 domain-containing protein [Ramlibacter albus]|uniref:DUF3604 domain-containing protein n=1 Tax=Ramlibacter albus TaxID=2079448 RepID=A0A923MCW2_9BURK|nr:DUF3604 domain-containing protein [Ramlibacter albus]MBC5768048.1 DUF3604 domain-containing protein [Ramlibacter albus]
MDDHRLLFGDIHNHNAHGYGVGSIERSLDIARTHLDFFAFTGHSSWHDMPAMEGGRERHWIDGFKRLKDTWPRVQQVIADGNRDNAFCAFLGFEWHSSHWGDQCVVFPGDHRPLHYTSDPHELRRFCRDENALMIPHHLAYPSGHRGVNWDAFCEECTPVVEVYSEHGNGEEDRGPLTYFSHSMGGRQTSNTAAAGLANGLRFGFVGSSDDHAGFPGAYGEGLMAAWVKDFTREGIFEAIRARRTYALTGDRIEVDFRVDGAPMGSTIEAGAQVEVAFDVRGRDEIDVVEVIQDGHIVHRAYADERVDAPRAFDSPVQLRLEWGWGPWGALALDRVCDWAMRVEVTHGRLLRHFPCLQSMPYDEQRRHRFTPEGDRALAIRSYSARQGAYRENPNQSVVLEVAASVDTVLQLTLTEPSPQHTSSRMADLFKGSHNLFTGGFPKEGYQWHRLVPLAASSLAGRVTLAVPPRRSHVYLRVKQKNGQLAWASPVFINYR